MAYFKTKLKRVGDEYDVHTERDGSDFEVMFSVAAGLCDMARDNARDSGDTKEWALKEILETIRMAAEHMIEKEPVEEEDESTYKAAEK